jgi:WD40 repeat protein
MTNQRRCLAFLYLALLACSAGAAAPPTRHGDLHGDPLPAGAVARLGTQRLYHREVNWLAFSPDGRALASASADDVRVWEVSTGRLLWRRKHRLFAGYGWSWSLLDFSPDSKVLAVGSADGSVRLWDVDTGGEREVIRTSAWPPGAREGRQRRLLPHLTITNVVFSPDGGRLAAGCDRGPVSLIDPKAGKVIWQQRAFDSVETLAFSADGKSLVAFGHDSRLTSAGWCRWDTATGEKREEGKLASTRGYNGRLSPDGRLAALLGLPGGGLRLRDARSGKELPVGPGKADAWSQPAFSGDGKRVAAGDRDGVVSVWETAGGKRVHSFRATPKKRIRVVALSGDGQLLALVNQPDDAIHIWAPARGKEVHAFEGHRSGPLTVAFSADGKTLVTASRDTNRTSAPEWADWSLRRWDAASGRQLAVTKANLGGQVYWASFSPGGSRLLTVLQDGTMGLWDAKAGKQLRRWKGPTFDVRNGDKRFAVSAIYWPCFSLDGKTIFATDNSGVYRWEEGTGKELARLARPKGSASRCLAGPDGRSVFELVWSAKAEIVMLDTASGRSLRRFPAESISSTFTVSPEGRTIAVWDRGAVRLLEVESGAERGRFEPPGRFVSALAFSPDARLLVVAVESEIQVYDLADSTRLRRFEGHEGRVETLAFSPDGARLASAGYDHVALIWRLSGLPIRRPRPNFRHSPQEWAELWADLSGPDPARAYRAGWRLAAAPRQSPPLLKGRLEALTARADEKKLAGLIAGLESDDFEVREKAHRELEGLGRAAEAALRKRLAASPSAEGRRRLEALLKRLEAPGAPSHELIGLRVIEALEHAGSAEARAALEGLAKDGRGERVKEEAKAALGRLARRP